MSTFPSALQSSMQQPANELKRKVLMCMLGAALLGTIPGWILKESLHQSSPLLRLILGLNTIFHPVMFFITWRRLLSQRTIELCCFLFAAIVFAGCMAMSLYSPVYGPSMDLEPLYLWIPVIYVFAFTLVDHPYNLRLSLAIFVLFFLVSLPYLVRPSHTHTVFTITLHTVSAALIAAMYFFASYQQRFHIAQLTVDELARLANTDELTGLANRRRVVEVMETELRRLVRYGHSFSIILMDIDHFKAINDRLGHDMGDQALKALAQRCSEALRDVDLMGRWGGEEFIVVLPQTSYEESLIKASALCAHVTAAPLIAEEVISVSCGVTSASRGEGIGTMVQRADIALYEAKRSGRNCAIGVAATS